MKLLKSLYALAWAKVKAEPVAVWGVVGAAVAGALLTAGVDPTVVAGLIAAERLVGIPIVRSKVTPMQALEAIVGGTDQPTPKDPELVDPAP